MFMKSIKMHNGAVFASGMEGKWLFTGGLDKTVNVQVHVQNMVSSYFILFPVFLCDEAGLLCYQTFELMQIHLRVTGIVRRRVSNRFKTYWIHPL